MKKHIKLLALIAIALVALCVFASCNDNPADTKAPETNPPPTTESDPPATNPPESTEDSTGDSTEDSTEDSTGGNQGDDELFEIDPGLNKNGKYTVRFLAYAAGSDYENPTYELFCEVEVAPGGRARPNGRPADIRGWKWAMTWDKDLSDVNQSMVVCAKYNKLDDFYVSFYDYEGNPIEGKTEILRFDGERLDVEDVPTVGKVKGKYFAGWSLVDSKDATATAETVTDSYTKGVKGNMILKAYYADCTVVAPFVKEEIVIDGYMDDAYQKYSLVDGKYINAVPFFVDKTGEYVTDGGSGADKNNFKNTSFWQDPETKEREWPDTEADTYVIWDGEWIYFMVEVTDNTLGTRSAAYVINTPNAYQNDTVEFWYNFEQNHTAVTNKMKVGIDAFGLRQFGSPDNQKKEDLSVRSMSWWFKYIMVATSVLMADGETWTSVKYDENNNLVDKNGQILERDANGQPDVGNKFRVEIALPALTEPTVGDPDNFGEKTLEQVIEDRLASGHVALEAYDVLRICLQSNDVKAWTEEDAEGNAVVDAGKGDNEPKFYSKNFAAGGRTQYYYPVYDTISLAADGDYNAE